MNLNIFKYIFQLSSYQLSFFFVIAFCSNSEMCFAQKYYLAGGAAFFSYTIDSAQCNNCVLENIGIINPDSWGGPSFGPDGNLYVLSIDLGVDIYEVDTANGNTTLIMQGPDNLYDMYGFVSVGGGIHYSIPHPNEPSDSLYRWDENAGTVIAIGILNYPPFGDLWMANGEIYYMSHLFGSTNHNIIKVNLADPSNCQLILSIPFTYNIFGLTATTIPDIFIGTDTRIGGDHIVNVNITDGTITDVCSFSGSITGFSNNTSPLEHGLFPEPQIFIDLDCDDSSGATGPDYNAPSFDCLNEGGIQVTDMDIRILIDTDIQEMTIEITNPLDSPNEFLDLIGPTPEINVSGVNTTSMLLSNAGNAQISDFDFALKQVRYQNNTLIPTEGMRVIEVQFTTQSGGSSNIATAYIEVIELFPIPLELGPDTVVCEGASLTIDAGVIFVDYQWSTGETTQQIMVQDEGVYSVTVSSNSNCPNSDEITVIEIPNLNIWLTGDEEVCYGEEVTLMLHADGPVPYDIEIGVNPGAPLLINDLVNDYSFTANLFATTAYTILNVVPPVPACINLLDGSQIIQVHPNFQFDTEITICEGESVLIGNEWETEAGFYPLMFTSQYGCDSLVNINLLVDPVEYIYVESTTCTVAEAGVFITYLSNPAGCDTIVETTVSLLPIDTMSIAITSCNLVNTGVFTQILTNQEGCDSIIWTTVSYIPPADTTTAVQISCDTSLVGIHQQIFSNQAGCDSLVITTIHPGSPDSTYLSATSCDSASLGVFTLHYLSQTGCDSTVITSITFSENDSIFIQGIICDSSLTGIFIANFTNQFGCDSIVTTTVSHITSDSVFIHTSSCDSMLAGVFIENLINRFGCDSIVTTTVTHITSDIVFIYTSTCDPDEVGVFVQNLVNRFGCDSIVTETISLLPADEIFISTTTCDPSETGVFVDTLFNQFGCDSIVTETVELSPQDETYLFSSTCNSAEAGMFITSYLNQYGCDSIVIQTVSLTPADSTFLYLKTCDPDEVGSNQILFTNQSGCDSLVIGVTGLFPLPELELYANSNFNGYEVSCSGKNDGSAGAIINGVQPWTYQWSTGSQDQSITGLAAGYYAVTITDGNGCSGEAEIILKEPEPFSIQLTISHPDCFVQDNGVITINPTGGIAPIRYSIDGVNFQLSSTFNNLTGGTFTVSALDDNLCEAKEIIWINVPLQVNVDLGEDQTLYPGDTGIIQAIVDVPYDSLVSITWSGLDNSNCPNCLSQPVSPVITTTYTVSVTTVSGCSDADDMTIHSERNIDIYIPNIFSPNGDNINDYLLIDAQSGIEEISSFAIYDRWGNLVFSANHFLPGDPSNAWDGKRNGMPLNPGVFAYRLVVTLVNGKTEARYGDITLVR